MPGFLDFLLGRGSGLYPFEVSAIEEVIARLDRESGSRLRKQVDVINKVQRIVGGKEVNLYQVRHGKPAFDDSLRFAGTGEEALLATVTLQGSSVEKAKLKLELWLAEGRLFSLVFNKSPKEFFADDQLRTVQPRITDIKIWFDPMQPREGSRDVTSISLSGWLKDWQTKGRVSELQSPLPLRERTAALERIDAVLPANYLDLISQTGGAKLGDCVIHDATNVRKIVSADANYYVLGDAGTRSGLVVKEGSQDGELYALNYEDDSMRQMGRSLKDAVASMLGMPQNGM